MATIQKNLDMVNFVCKFGDFDLLDLFYEVVTPAFFNETHKRTFRGSDYYFRNVELVDFGKDPLGDGNLLAITGKFIKNTIISREQFENDKGEIVIDPKGLASAPSSLFVLMLNSHRLLFVHETKDAPNIHNLKSTIISFLRSELNKYSSSLEEEEKAKFTAKYAYPTITIMPLSTEKDIIEHLEQFEKIKKVKITLNDRNSEFDASKMFNTLHHVSKEMNASASLEFKNFKEGLDKVETPKEVAEALRQDNQTVMVQGVTHDGENLTLKNDDFKLIKKINLVQGNIMKSISNMVSAFKSLVKSGDITVKDTDEKTQTVLDSIDPESVRLNTKEET